MTAERGDVIEAIKEALRSCEVRTTDSGHRELVVPADPTESRSREGGDPTVT